MKIVVEGTRGEVVDSVSRELTLPDFTRVQVAFATPRVYRGRTVRELTAIKANPASVPTADRDFSRTDRLLIRTEAYTPGGAVPTLTARLLNRGGGKMADLPVQAGSGGAADIELPLSSLAAGDYLIELNAKSETGACAGADRVQGGAVARGSGFGISGLGIAVRRAAPNPESRTPSPRHYLLQNPVTLSSFPSGVSVNTLVPAPVLVRRRPSPPNPPPPCPGTAAPRRRGRGSCRA